MAGAIENARLHQRLAEREEALERFAERTVEWQEHERRRLAGEIHDGISQRIVSLFFHLSAAADAIPASPTVAAEQVARAQELAAAALDETRSAIAGLRPPVLDDLGLVAEPDSLAHSFPTLDVRVEAAELRMAEHAETAVYRTSRKPCRTWPSTPTRSRCGCGCCGTRTVSCWKWPTTAPWAFDTTAPSGPGPTGFGLAACGSGPSCSAAASTWPPPRAAALPCG